MMFEYVCDTSTAFLVNQDAHENFV